MAQKSTTNLLSIDCSYCWRTLTLRLLKLVDEELDRVIRLVDDQRSHHVFKDLVEALLLDVLLAPALEVNLLLFQHHLAVQSPFLKV